MSKRKKRIYNYKHQTFDLMLKGEPNSCPFCHEIQRPHERDGYITVSEEVQVAYTCISDSCGNSFFGYYSKRFDSTFGFSGTSFGVHKSSEVPVEIVNLSPSFNKIYLQAMQAEKQGLDEICGIGLRKALEFLIKDFLIKLHPQSEEQIKKDTLMKCIKGKVDNPKLRDVAERAAWLGNDETHYVRKWENKDINDLKLLIKISIHWVEMELLTMSYSEDMDKGKQN